MRVCVHHACNDCAHYRDRTLMHTHTQPNIYVRDPRTSNLPSLVMRLVSRRENSSGCGNTTAASATKIDPPSYTPGVCTLLHPGVAITYVHRDLLREFVGHRLQLRLGFLQQELDLRHVGRDGGLYAHANTGIQMSTRGQR